jgi:hypothetical protein
MGLGFSSSEAEAKAAKPRVKHGATKNAALEGQTD